MKQPVPQPEAPSRRRILVVDDESSLRELLRIVLSRDGYEVVVATNGQEAIQRLQAEPFDLLLTDIRMPEANGIDVLRTAKQVDPHIVAFMLTAHASTETAVEAMRLGASDYFIKESPFRTDELRLKVRQHLETRRIREEHLLFKRQLNSRDESSNILGHSDAIQRVLQTVQTIASTNSTVLITGESGTGKELIARKIHNTSLRGDRPFVAVNCGAVPETLLESELFGHVRGAFTDAHTNKKGLIETAEGGTIMLDEIGEMPPLMQVKLLRVLQDHRFRRLGSTQEVQADVRIIAATNRELTKMVAEGSFREDLYYRLNVLAIRVPPLRERAEDIPVIAEHFLREYASRMGKPVQTISADAMRLLQHHHWRGNVRELQNALERAVALEQTEAVLPESLPDEVRRSAGPKGPAPPDEGFPDLGEGFDLEARGEEFYRHYLALALERAGGVQVKAAELLGMSFRSFRYYAKKYSVK